MPLNLRPKLMNVPAMDGSLCQPPDLQVQGTGDGGKECKRMRRRARK